PPGGLLANAPTAVSVGIFPSPSVEPYRRPSYCLPAGFLLDHVPSYFWVFSLQILLHLCLDRHHRLHVVGHGSRKRHDLFIILPLVKRLEILPLRSSKNDTFPC